MSDAPIVPIVEQEIVGVCHYNGDARSGFEMLAMYGPTQHGEWRFPVFAEYDEETNKTTLHWSNRPPMPTLENID